MTFQGGFADMARLVRRLTGWARLVRRLRGLTGSGRLVSVHAVHWKKSSLSVRRAAGEVKLGAAGDGIDHAVVVGSFFLSRRRTGKPETDRIEGASAVSRGTRVRSPRRPASPPPLRDPDPCAVVGLDSALPASAPQTSSTPTTAASPSC
jgi:hypothetical protein